VQRSGIKEQRGQAIVGMQWRQRTVLPDDDSSTVRVPSDGRSRSSKVQTGGSATSWLTDEFFFKVFRSPFFLLRLERVFRRQTCPPRPVGYNLSPGAPEPRTNPTDAGQSV